MITGLGRESIFHKRERRYRVEFHMRCSLFPPQRLSGGEKQLLATV